MTYAEKLKDPRWKLKREDVIERAGDRCELCNNSQEEYEIHHKQYRPNAEPWEYDLYELECLCESCHMTRHSQQRAAKTHEAAVKVFGKGTGVFNDVR